MTLYNILSLTMRLFDEGGDDVGEGGHEAHHDTPVKRHGHDAVHDEDDKDEIPSQQERVLYQIIGLQKMISSERMTRDK